MVLVPPDCEAARLSCLLHSDCGSSRVGRLLRRGPRGPSSLFSRLLLSPHTAKLAPMLIVSCGASVFPPPFAFFARPSPAPSCSNMHDYIQYFYRCPHPPPVPLDSPVPLADSTSPPPQKPNQCQFFCDPSLYIFWPLKKNSMTFFCFSDMFRFCIPVLYFIINYHRIVFHLSFRLIWDFSFLAPRNSMTFFRILGMLRFCTVSLYFMLNYHRTVFPCEFRRDLELEKKNDSVVCMMCSV